MKKVKLLELELTNYRNIEHELYVFNGNNSKIVGENRIGKTNTLEAIYFLLTNYLLDGSSDLTQLKPLDDTSKVVSVRGKFMVDDKTYELEKHYAEDWVKTRGSTELTMKGHYQEYLFNGIKCNTSLQYFNSLEEVFGYRNDRKENVDYAQMLTNPLYLGNLGDTKDWTNLRAFIIKLIGDVTDEEVFAKEPSVKPIQEDLEKAIGKVDVVKKMYADKIKGAQAQIDYDNAQIELLQKTDVVSEEEYQEAVAKTNELNKQLLELELSLQNNSLTESVEKEITALKQRILSLNTKEYIEWQNTTTNLNREKFDLLSKANDELDKLLDESTNIKIKLGKEKEIITTSEYRIKNCDQVRSELVAQLKEIREQIANADSHIEKVCPTCGKPLDEEKIVLALNNYTRSLQARQDEVIAKGTENSNNKAKYEEQLKEATANYGNIDKELTDVTKRLVDKRNEVNAIKASISIEQNKVVVDNQFEESDELKQMRLELSKKERELTDAMLRNSERKGDIYGQINKIKDAVKDYQKVIYDHEYYARQMAQLEGLKDSLKEHTKELVNAEQKKELLELYTYTKLHLLDYHVANVFGNIRFQLIKENINGGFDPVCKPYIYDVAEGKSTNTIWKSGSKSEKIATGIAIVESIKQKLNLAELPYLFDEGGEVSSNTFASRLLTDAQIICVKVEDNTNKPVVVSF